MSEQLDKDIASAKAWLISNAGQFYENAKSHAKVVAAYTDAVEVACACAALPGDMALRVRLTPNVFNLRA